MADAEGSPTTWKFTQYVYIIVMPFWLQLFAAKQLQPLTCIGASATKAMSRT